MKRSRKKTVAGLCAILCVCAVTALAAHDEDEPGPGKSLAAPTEVPTSGTRAADPAGAFPTLHPLVVHFPIVLLLVASVLYPAGLLFRSEPVKLAGWAPGLAGLAAACLATYWIHPHTGGLTSAARATLELHERFADLTIVTAAIAVPTQIIGHALRRRGVEYVGAFVMIVAAVFVSIAGHYGAQLTHIHGVGPRGEFLEQHRH